MTAPAFPIVDLAAYEAPDQPAGAAGRGRICRDSGVLALAHHGVPDMGGPGRVAGRTACDAGPSPVMSGAAMPPGRDTGARAMTGHAFSALDLAAREAPDQPAGAAGRGRICRESVVLTLAHHGMPDAVIQAARRDATHVTPALLPPCPDRQPRPAASPEHAP